MNATCPSCGRPIRPGSKFCGNCGATLPSTPAGKPPAVEGAPAASQRACPHCGKPVRLESRFCPFCGQTLTKAEPLPASPSPETLPSVPPAQVDIQPTPAPAKQAQPQTAAPIQREAQQQPPGKKKPAPRKRTGRFWLLVGGAIALIIVFAAFSVFMLSKAGVFDRATETPTITTTGTATTTLTIVPSQTSTPSPTQTLTPSPTNTFTVTPSPTALSEATITPTTTVSPTSSMSPPESSLAIGATPVLTETFSSENLEQTWTVWGTSYSINDGKLELKGLTPTDTGFVSKQDFLAREATIIQFEVSLMGNSSQDVILFNWDPKTVNRNSETDPGPIHIQIGGDKSIIKVDQAELRFSSPDNQAHKYAIKILKEGILAFFYDDQEIGKLPLPRQTNVNGKISFSGTGWIDNVVVITPTAINTPQPTTKPATK